MTSESPFVSAIEKEIFGFASAGLHIMENGFTQTISLFSHFLGSVITSSFPPLGVLGPIAMVATIGLTVGAAAIGFSLVGGARDLSEVTP